MAQPPEKIESLRDKFKRAKERRIAELLEKFQQKEEENNKSNASRIMEQIRKKSTADRIIGSTEETFETTSAQQKIDPVRTTKEVAVTTEIDQDINLRPSTMLLTEDKSVQTLIPMKIRRSKCINCCGGLPGCGPGLGQGCDRRCSCIPGLQIREKVFCDDEEFTQDSIDKIQLPRLFVTRHRGNRLRGGGCGGVLDEDSRQTKMPRICCREEKNSSLSTQSLLLRGKRKGSTVDEKEHRLPRRFRRSLSSPRGQLARWKEERRSYCESCLRGGLSCSGKNCVGHESVSAECVPTSYNSVSEVLPGISERPRNFRRKQNVMAAARMGWTSRSNKLRRRTTASSPLLALSATSKCFRKGFVNLVGDKCREYVPWETPSIAFDERGWFDSSFGRDFELFSMLGNKTSREGRDDCSDGYSLSVEFDKTISNTSDARLRSSTRNRFYFPLEIMIRVRRRSKSCRNYNFSQQRGYPSRLVLKLERNGQERLRGGGSTFDLIRKRKLQRETNSKDQSTMDNLDDTVITPICKDREKNVTGVTFSENTCEDECFWSHDLTNERVQRFREDQGYCGGPEHPNEDERIRGGCGGFYKPVQRSYFSNASTILGRRDLQYPRSPCCPPIRPQVSCRTAPAGRPRSCQRSSPICSSAKFQNHVSCGRIDSSNDTEECCPCNSCGGPACNDNSNLADINRCCRTQQREQQSCQCRCQTCKGFRSCGGCGGQSCGRIYSCAGSGGGTCCFPRNTGRRNGSECCHGGNSNCGGCC